MELDIFLIFLLIKIESLLCYRKTNPNVINNYNLKPLSNNSIKFSIY